MQYALVGGVGVFYLLLLLFSEHIGFALAYLLSAGGCVLLIGFYVGHRLRSVRHGLSFSAGLAALYGLLFGLLSAEDYALLMGSLLLFGLLGVFKMLTRSWIGTGLGRNRPSRWSLMLGRWNEPVVGVAGGSENGRGACKKYCEVVSKASATDEQYTFFRKPFAIFI